MDSSDTSKGIREFRDFASFMLGCWILFEAPLITANPSVTGVEGLENIVFEFQGPMLRIIVAHIVKT